MPALGVPPIKVIFGSGNGISWAPHPNPPALDALTLVPAQPTSIVHSLPGQLALVNLLAPGANFLGVPAIGLPPTNMLARPSFLRFQSSRP